MNNFIFLQKIQNLQYGIMLDKIINMDFVKIGYCQGDSSIFWNYALINKVLGENELSRIEGEMKSLNRQPTVYFENKKPLQPFIKFLKNRGYKFGFEDSWMFHDGKNIDKTRFNSVKKVTTKKELEVFLKIFDACYQKNDPQNAYGELGDYLKVAEKVWHRHHKTNRLKYFIAYNNNNKAVAVSTLTDYKGIGYISNVGSLKKVRGQGFGKLATLYCVEQSKKRGNKQHCLATEEGTYANQFYKRVGFKTRFTAVGYVKEKAK